MHWLDDLLDLVFPSRPVCPLCGEKSAGAKICARCLEELARHRKSSRCLRCGRFRVGAAGPAWQKSRAGSLLCPECANGEHCFTLARSAGPYEGGLKEAVHRFKFAKRRSLARPLGGLLAGVVKEILFLGAESFLQSGAAGLVPVPLARAREQERGFNQSELLAREAAALTGLPVLPILQKVRETLPQTGLSRGQRKANLSGAFRAVNPARIPAGRSVILVDDVLTTGFTADECARVLYQAGIKGVYVATLATAL